MKLFEIFDTDDRGTTQLNRKLKTFNPRFNNDLGSDDDEKKVGKGSFSYVKPTPNDPHTVKKTQAQLMMPDHNIVDAFPFYAKVVIRDKLAQKNPHFPRIYKTKSFRGSDGITRQQWEMEKLDSLSSLSDKEIEMLNDRYFNDPRHDVSDGESFLDILAWDTTEDDIKDETLEQAMDQLQQIKMMNNLSWDLHDENYMIRRTGQGPQIVFTDPFTQG